jgi:hypothetical protein
LRDGAVWSLSVIGDGGRLRDLAGLVVPATGSLEATSCEWEPYRLTGPDGAVVDAVTAWFGDLQAAGRSAATLRSYGMDLLRSLR